MNHDLQNDIYNTKVQHSNLINVQKMYTEDKIALKICPLTFLFGS